MYSTLIKITDSKYLIKWEDEDQYGEVSMCWDFNLNKLIVDTEMLKIETFIKIIKSL